MKPITAMSHTEYMSYLATRAHREAWLAGWDHAIDLLRIMGQLDGDTPLVTAMRAELVRMNASNPVSETV